jgi:hypothetical protein
MIQELLEQGPKSALLQIIFVDPIFIYGKDITLGELCKGFYCMRWIRGIPTRII